MNGICIFLCALSLIAGIPLIITAITSSFGIGIISLFIWIIFLHFCSKIV